MYFAILHQDSMCNGVWFLVGLLTRVKSSPFWERLEVNLTFLAFMCINIIAVCFDSIFPWFASHFISSGDDPAHCPCYLTSHKKCWGHDYLMMRKMLASLKTSCLLSCHWKWWSQDISHSQLRHLFISHLAITSFPKGNGLTSERLV